MKACHRMSPLLNHIYVHILPVKYLAHMYSIQLHKALNYIWLCPAYQESMFIRKDIYHQVHYEKRLVLPWDYSPMIYRLCLLLVATTPQKFHNNFLIYDFVWIRLNKETKSSGFDGHYNTSHPNFGGRPPLGTCVYWGGRLNWCIHAHLSHSQGHSNAFLCGYPGSWVKQNAHWISPHHPHGLHWKCTTFCTTKETVIGITNLSWSACDNVSYHTLE